MLIIPAIDLLDGKCVRLFRGQYDSSQVYSDNPSEVAVMFENQGAQWIHIVDLDAARGQGRNNRKAIRDIRDSVSCMIEVGGGIRTEKDVEELLEIGADRLILGTILVKEPDTVRDWAHRYGSVFVAGIDADEGNVKISGWESDARIQDMKLVEQIDDMGLCGIIYTSISHDGTMKGPDIDRTNKIASKVNIPVILSGGISSYKDIKNVFSNKHAQVKGIISGKALYENSFNLEEIIDEFQLPYQTPPDDDW